MILGSRGLAPLLPSFTAKYPQVRVELALHDRVVDLMDEGFDAALRSGPLPDLPLVAHALAPLAMLLCATPAYLRRRGTPRTPADLSSHACLGFSHWMHQDRWRLLGPDGQEHLVPVQPPPLTSNNGEALRQAALAGGGILMQWEPLLREDLAAGRLVRVLPRYAPPRRPAHLLHLPQRHPSAKLRRFIEHVVKHLGARRPGPAVA